MANDIKYDIIADATRFSNGVRTAEKDAQRLQKTMSQINASSVNQSMGAAGGRSRMAMMELARGAEDAAIVFGTQGLSGALRASANNLSQMAFLMSPTAGMITSMTIAGVALGSSLLKMGNEAEEAAKQIDAIGDSYDRLAELSARQIKFQTELSAVRTEESWKKQVEENARATEEATAKLEVRTREVKNQQQALKALEKTEKEVFQVWSDAGEWGLGTLNEMRTGAITKSIERTKDEIADATRQAKALNQEVQQLQRERAALLEMKPEAKRRKEIDDEEREANAILERQKQLAKSLYEETKGPQERYTERLKEINDMRRHQMINERDAQKFADAAYQQLLQQTAVQQKSNQLLAEAADIRSAAAYSIAANAMASSLMPSLSKPSRLDLSDIAADPGQRVMQMGAMAVGGGAGGFAAGGVGNDPQLKKIEDIERKMLDVLERQLREFGRRPEVNLRVAGMN